jgi:ABC-type antimicrobial peptide transport system permease subunit
MAAYSVSKRIQEPGVRMALGARRREVLSAALGHAIRLLAIGSGAGLILGVLASRVLASLVYEATPRDPLVLAGVVTDEPRHLLRAIPLSCLDIFLDNALAHWLWRMHWPATPIS